MITAAIHGVTISPQAPVRTGDAYNLSVLASEISERVCEMNELRSGAGTDFVLRLASMARLDRGSFAIVIAIMHGDTSVLTDSYSERGEQAGRKKQTIHYRTLKEIENIEAVFPEVTQILEQLRLSVKHHEDPISKGQIIRNSAE